MDAKLLRAYCRTTYVVETGNGTLSLRIGVLDAEFGRWCDAQQMTSWAFITAVNPWSRPLKPDENATRMANFERLLRNEGRRFWPAAGVPEDDSWEAEPGLLIANLSPAEARAYGEQFGQNAIVHAQQGTPPELVVLVPIDAAVLDEAEQDCDAVVRWTAGRIRASLEAR